MHLFARGEQNEGADGFFGADELGQPFGDFGGMGVGLLGTGGHGRDVELALGGEVEGAFQREGGGFGQPLQAGLLQ